MKSSTCTTHHYLPSSCWALSCCKQRLLQFLPRVSSLGLLSLYGQRQRRQRDFARTNQFTKTQPVTKKKALHPKAGDIVRYYDLDGGDVNGQVLVGKIAYIQKVMGSDSWAVEITQLEDVGDGYFAEYSSRQRSSKKCMRPQADVAPIAASWVRTEAAFKIPRSAGGVPAVRAEQYDLDTYPGPFAGENVINQDIVKADWEIYTALKGKLIKEAVLLSVAGTLRCRSHQGPGRSRHLCCWRIGRRCIPLSFERQDGYSGVVAIQAGKQRCQSSIRDASVCIYWGRHL